MNRLRRIIIPAAMILVVVITLAVLYLAVISLWKPTGSAGSNQGSSAASSIVRRIIAQNVLPFSLLIDGNPSDIPVASSVEQNGVDGISMTARAIELTPDEKDWIAAHPTLFLAVDNGYAPKNFLDENGKMAGISIDYINLLAERLGLSVAYEGSGWAEALDKALQHKVDGIINADMLEERKPYLNFSEVYSVYPQALVTRKDIPNLKSFLEMKGRKIGVVTDSSQMKILQENYPELLLVEIPDVPNGLERLVSGELDGVYDDIAVLDYEMTRNYYSSLKFTLLYSQPPVGYSRIGLRNDDPMLLAVINKAIATLSEEDDRKIQQKWIGTGIQLIEESKRKVQVDLTEEELDWLKQHPVVRVGSDPRYPPIEYVNEKGSFEGVSRDYLDMLENTLGIRFVPAKGVDWSRLLEMARTHEIDMLSAVSPTVERKANFDFSLPYLTLPVGIFSRGDMQFGSGLTGLSGRKVAVVQDYAVYDWLRADYPQIVLMRVKSVEEGLSLVKSRQVDAFVENTLTTGNLIAQNNMTYIRMTGETPYQYNFSMAVRKDWPILSGILDKFFAAFTESERNRIYNKWVVLTYVKQVDLSTLWQVLGISLLVLMVSAAWIVRLSAEIRRRRRVEAELANAKEVAVSANLAKSQFLANMSHEIRTPINAISGFNHLLRRTALSDRQREYVEKSIISTKALISIINNILDYSKIEAERVQLERIEFDLFDVLSTVSDIMSLRVFEKKLKMTMSVHPEVPEILVGDPHRLHQILINLVNNAVKFTDKGEVSLSVTLQELQTEQAVLAFSIRDTGIGISSDQMVHLFQSFEQADMSTTRKYGGTGLGLSISKRLAEMMGGTIQCASEPGKGSVFTFNAAFGLSARTTLLEQPLGILKALRVLLVSDNRDLIAVLSEEMERLQLLVTVSASDTGSIERAVDGKSFDLLFLDWETAGTGTPHVAERIRESMHISHAEVFLVSAVRDNELLSRLEDATVGRVIYYPASQSQLFNVMLEAVESRHPFRAQQGMRHDPRFKSLQQALILLVEDNEINQFVARDLLEDAGIRVELAVNGAVAVEKMAMKHYDGILMDLQMPVMDGYEATRRIRGMPSGNKIPIVAMTAEVVSGVREKVLEAGMDAYITKPVDPLALLLVLKRHIHRGTGDGTDERRDDLAMRGPDETAALVSPDAMPDRLPGLHVEKAVSMMNGKTAAYLHMLSLYEKNHLHAAADIRSAVTAGNDELAIRLAHTLKSVSASIGAEKVSGIASDILAALRQSEKGMPDISQTEMLDMALSEVGESIRLVLGTHV